MPVPLLHTKASVPAALSLYPTTIDPSAETPRALLKEFPPGNSPRPTIPPPLVQRKDSPPAAPVPWPTTVEPSAETPAAPLRTAPPGRSPRPTIPPPLVQRKASPEMALLLVLPPTTAEPSAETAEGSLTKPPGKCPSGTNIGDASPELASQSSKLAPRLARFVHFLEPSEDARIDIRFSSAGTARVSGASKARANEDWVSGGQLCAHAHGTASTHTRARRVPRLRSGEPVEAEPRDLKPCACQWAYALDRPLPSIQVQRRQF